MDPAININASELLKRAKLVFWDFDGVIKESVDIKTQAYLLTFSLRKINRPNYFWP